MFQLNQQQNPVTEAELNGFIENSPIYVTSYPPDFNNSSSHLNTSTSSLSNKPQQPQQINQQEKQPTTQPQQQQKQQQEDIQQPQEQQPIKSQPPQPEQQQQPPPPPTQQQKGTLSNGHSEEQEIELKQELSCDSSERTSEEVSSVLPFTNGRTEVLIGQDALSDTKVRTTAIVENHRASSLGVSESR